MGGLVLGGSSGWQRAPAYHILRIVVAEWTAALERHPGHGPSFTGAVDRAANRLGLELDATDVQLPRLLHLVREAPP